MTSLVKSFWNYKNELGVSSDIIFLNDKIVVQKSRQSEMLKRIHKGNLGLERCKIRLEMKFIGQVCRHR